MKVKKVEIKGFKSLAKKTTLTLSDGVTCIAGPNGCGKSNVIDAIRWALGEQSSRSLRAGAMSDVIFSGTQDSYPGNMAQVTLEFIRDGGYFPKSLDGFDEVAVSRKLFRTGESIYSINGVKCRLKDITDIFLDTGLDRHGYAIIEQGKVKDIIQSKPEDIRYLIEEAAEVGKFRIKRADAIKRLEATSNNLERIQDLLNEVSRQKDDLRAQANKAKRYQKVRDKINELTRALWAHELHAISEIKADLSKEIQEIDTKLQAFERQHLEYTKLIDSHRSRLSEVKEKIDFSDKSLNEAQSRLRVSQGDIDSNQERKKDIASTLEMLQARIDQLKETISHENNELETGQKGLKLILDDIELVKTELASDQEEGSLRYHEYKKIEDDYNQTRAELFDAIGHARAMEQRISSLNSRYLEVISNTKRRKEDFSGISEQKTSLQRQLHNLDKAIENANTEHRDIEQKIQAATEEIDVLQKKIEEESLGNVSREKEHAQLAAKTSMLDRIINSGPKDPSGATEQSNGTRKVSDTLRVHAGFEETVGRSMGEALDFVIIRDHDEVHDFLTAGNASPGYILKQPHLSSTDKQVIPAGSGVVGPLSEYMDAQDGFENVVSALSQDMWVVEDIQCALMMWKQGMRSCSLVTKEGIIIEPTGVIRTTAEMTKYADSLKAKAEKEQLLEKMLSMETEIEHAKSHIRKLKDDLTELNQEKTLSLQKEKTIKADIAKLTNSHNDIARELERITERQNSYEHDINLWEEMAKKILDDLSGLSSEKKLLDDDIERKQVQIKDLDEKREDFKGAYDKATEAIQAKTSRMNDLKVAYASKNERLQGIQTNLDKMNQEINKDLLRIEELKQTESSIVAAIDKAGSDVAKAQHSIKEMEEQRAQLLPEFDELSDTMNSLSESKDQCKETIDHLEKTKNSFLLRQKEQEIAYSMSIERMHTRFGKDIPDVPEGFCPEEARENAEALEKRIEKMGQINFASIDAFENVQTRWDDLHRQYEDIVQASTRLKEVIANIERQSTKAFMATYEKVKTNFQKIFTTIFGGGKADIVLTQSEGMEPGVEIFASPPFKRLRAMSLLSEGEKTLCALSFIFALFMVRPSPFCILDEVDAPLDDANVIRFNRLIRSFSKDSQFIIVTHNRYTMEMADIIYGVTFDVPGISKVVSMVLQEQEG